MTTYRLPDGIEAETTEPGLVHVGLGHWLRHPSLGTIWVGADRLTEVKPPLPPEPKPWAAVSDSHGKVWQNIGKEPAPWRCADGRSTNWEALNSAYGPLFRLVPDPADDGPMRQLIDAALAWVSYVQKASSPPSMWADTHDFKLIEAGDAYLAAREVES